MKAVSSLAGISQERLWVAEVESVLVAREFESQTLLGLASENLTLRAEASQSRGLFETLGCEKREMVMLT